MPVHARRALVAANATAFARLARGQPLVDPGPQDSWQRMHSPDVTHPIERCVDEIFHVRCAVWPAKKTPIIEALRLISVKVARLTY